jgi:hypothetical protein
MSVLFLRTVVLSFVLAVSSAEAQDFRSERPYRGLFGSGVADSEQLLRATASLGAGWDDNLVADATGRSVRVSDVSRGFRGGLGTGSLGLSYSLDKETVGLGASVGTTARYYPGLGSRLIRRDYATVGTSAVIGGGLTLQGSVAYQPYSLRSMMPGLNAEELGDLSIADEDFPASAEHYVAYAAGADYMRRVTARTTFNALYNYGGRERLNEGGRFDRHIVGGSLSRTLTRDLSLQLGYRFIGAQYGGEQDHVNHVIDAGVNYNRALSFSRRTTLSFSTGTSASRDARNEALRFRATGSARLHHEIGRTWNASVSYDRGLRYMESWPEPVFSDGATAGLTGLLNRRTQVQFVARAMKGRGRLGLTQEGSSDLESLSATAGLTYAVSRHINTGVSYTYYAHQFGSDVPLPPGFARDFDRRSVRAFVSVWAPLFQRARRP